LEYHGRKNFFVDGAIAFFLRSGDRPKTFAFSASKYLKLEREGVLENYVADDHFLFSDLHFFVWLVGRDWWTEFSQELVVRNKQRVQNTACKPCDRNDIDKSSESRLD
jgi:hypothetical protein